MEVPDVTNPKPLHARLADKIEVAGDGCWVFTGARRDGYGSISIGRRGDGVIAARIAARIASYLIHRGGVPSGLVLDHLCRNRRCCNPWHLEPVTAAENAHRGAKTKVTRDQVDEIRTLWQTTTMTKADIGRRFGLHSSHVGRIINQRRWPDREKAIARRLDQVA